MQWSRIIKFAGCRKKHNNSGSSIFYMEKYLKVKLLLRKIIFLVTDMFFKEISQKRASGIGRGANTMPIITGKAKLRL